MERSFDPTAGEVDLYPQDITRALLNLISNGFYDGLRGKVRHKLDLLLVGRRPRGSAVSVRYSVLLSPERGWPSV
jgi:hypothetical protein